MAEDTTSLIFSLPFQLLQIDETFTVNGNKHTQTHTHTHTPTFPLPYSNDLFDNNLFKSNPSKWHLLISSNDSVSVHGGEYEIEYNKCEILLGVKLDWKLNFSDKLSFSEKRSASAGSALLIALSKRRILMNTFFNSEFTILL